MNSKTQFGYGVHSGIAGIMKHRAASIASIVTTAACLLLISCLLMLEWNIKVNMSQFQAQNSMLAFVSDRLTQTEAMRLQDRIEGIEGIHSVTFITKEEAFDDYIAQYKDDANTEHLGPSILRDRYAIRVEKARDAEVVAEQLKLIDGIADVRLDKAITEGFETIQNVVLLLGVFLTILLLAVSAIIMTNTIKLTTLVRKEEIEVMKMMGAYDNFVRLPFLCEGCIVGLSGAILSFVMSAVLYAGIKGTMGGTGIFSLVSVASFASMAAPILFVVILLGLGIGVVGSFVAVKKYLEV